MKLRCDFVIIFSVLRMRYGNVFDAYRIWSMVFSHNLKNLTSAMVFVGIPKKVLKFTTLKGHSHGFRVRTAVS